MPRYHISSTTLITLLHFLLGVLRNFYNNNGLLLAGAIAYYTLLSIIPALALILLLLSNLIDPVHLRETLHNYLVLVSPNAADMLMTQVEQAINLPELIGGIGIVTLILFSGLAFRMTNNALQIIFSYRSDIAQRHSLLDLILPYLYVIAIAIAIAIIVGADTAYTIIKDTPLIKSLPLPAGNDELIGFTIGLGSIALLLTSFYRIMPIGKTSLTHAAIGGISAALLWEITRHLLTQWYNNISQVNMIYGTLATVVVLLLIIEAGAIIVLLGAQVIADYETRNQSPHPRRHP